MMMDINDSDGKYKNIYIHKNKSDFFCPGIIPEGGVAAASHAHQIPVRKISSGGDLWGVSSLSPLRGPTS